VLFTVNHFIHATLTRTILFVVGKKIATNARIFDFSNIRAFVANFLPI